MREIVVTETLRCDFCNEKHTEMHPVESRRFTWSGQEREIDLCPTDLKEVDHMIETLVEKAHRPERKTATKSSRPRTAPYTNDTRVKAFLNETSGMYECPGETQVEGEEPVRCSRQFTTPNGLAIHHKRKHGTHLLP